MAHIQLREKARFLRRRGESIRDISRKLRASKSTISYWCRDITLSPRQIRQLARQMQDGAHVGRLRAAERKRTLRIEAVKSASRQGAQDVGRLSNRDVFILGLALYWGKGYKSGNEECGLTNSDPQIIRAFTWWLQKTYKVPSSDLILRVSVNSIHKGRAKEIEKYWSNIIGIPNSQFTKMSFINARARKTYAEPEKHFGTLRVKVRRATALRRRVLGSIAEIARQI